MGDVEVRVPVRIRLVGTPTAEDLARLETAVTRLVAHRLEQAGRALTGPRPATVSGDLAGTRPSGAPDLTAARYEADLDTDRDDTDRDDTDRDDADRGYRVMSYQGPARPVRVPVTTPGPARPASPAAGSAAAQQGALRRITQLLSRGILDWAVTDAEAREVLRILRRLAPEDLVRVVQAMRLSGRWATLGRELPADADDDLIDLQQRLDPHSGYLMPGDTVRIELRLGTKLQEEISRDYLLYAGRLSLPMLPDALQVTGLLPAELPQRIVRAYVDALIYVEPWVKVAVVARGPLYAPRHGPTRGLLWNVSHRIERSPQDQAQLDKRRELVDYISAARPDDDLGRRAIDRYVTWVEKHYRTPEFLRQTGPGLWTAVLHDVTAPAPVSVRTSFLELASAMQRTVHAVPQAEQVRLGLALSDYLAWLDQQQDDGLARFDPVQVWARLYLRRVKEDVNEEVAEKLRRHKEAAAEAAAKVDWEAAGRKLDEALDLLQKRVWRVQEPYTLEDREAGVGYLVWESAQEKAVRDLIARRFLHDVIAAMPTKDFTATSATADFHRWLTTHPAEYEAYLLANAHPDVEKYEVEIDLPGWQTAIEVGIGFIPVVGSIVAAGEATFGYDLFGHRLSTVERAILGASILLPAAVEVFKAGRAAVTVARLSREYRLSAREADAAYRALTQVRPGTAGARLLESAAADVKAGRPVRDAERLHSLGDLFKDMGMTERSTAEELRAGAADSALEGHAGRTGQEAADLFATGDEVAATLEGEVNRPSVTGGQRPRIDDVSVRTQRGTKLDIEYIPRAAGETQRAALQRVKNVIGRRIEDTPLQQVWERARAKVVGGRNLENATRQDMFDLYNKVRDEFWTQARTDAAAKDFLERAGFEFPVTGKAPLLRVVDPPPGLVGWPKASEIPIQERRISLDHTLEKALGENYRRAIDADNLVFEFHNPNSNRETVQVKFGLRAAPGGSE